MQPLLFPRMRMHSRHNFSLNLLFGIHSRVDLPRHVCTPTTTIHHWSAFLFAVTAREKRSRARALHYFESKFESTSSRMYFTYNNNNTNRDIAFPSNWYVYSAVGRQRNISKWKTINISLYASFQYHSVSVRLNVCSSPSSSHICSRCILHGL